MAAASLPRPKRRSIRKAARFGAIAILLAATASCFGSKPKNEYFYYLTGPRGAVSKAAKKAPSLAVDDFVVEAGYGKSRIAYRTQINELRYYGYRSWVSPPAKMLQDMVMRHLRASGHFSQVEPEDRIKDSLATLEVTVEAIEELDKGSETLARLSMRFVVRDSSSQKVLLRYAFDRKFPCTKRHPREVAHGISKLLDLEMRKLATRISDKLK